MTALANQVAIVTGASRGIGRAVARKLASLGAQVVAVATNEALLAETARTIQAEGGKCSVAICDVSDSKSVNDCVSAIAAEHGGVNILVNNAGVTRDNLVMRLTDDDWQRVIDVNLKGAFNFCRAASRPLMKAKGGAIVNVASVVGIVGNAGQANYAASKGGLIALTKSLAKELASRNVRVNAVAPGFIETDMTDSLEGAVKEGALKGIPLARFGSGDDIAEAVAFLVSPAAGYITGAVLTVDGGMAM